MVFHNLKLVLMDTAQIYLHLQDNDKKWLDYFLKYLQQQTGRNYPTRVQNIVTVTLYLNIPKAKQDYFFFLA